MKPSIAIPLGVAGILAAIGTSIANANGWFVGHPHLIYLCWGGSAVLILVSIFGAILNARSEALPHFSLESRGEAHNFDPINTEYFAIRNLGPRSVRHVRFDSIESRRGLKISINEVASLAPTERRALEFHAGDEGEYRGVPGHLVNFFEGGSSNLDEVSYPIIIRFLDGVKERTERHSIHGAALSSGGVRMKIVPIV